MQEPINMFYWVDTFFLIFITLNSKSPSDWRAEVPVRLGSKTHLAPRSENVITVHCNKSMSSITADFEPATIKGVSGV